MISPEVAAEIGEMPLQSDMEIEETNSPTDLINIITLPKSNNYNNKGTNFSYHQYLKNFTIYYLHYHHHQA